MTNRLSVTDAIVAGILRAGELGLTKPHDIAISVKVVLDRHGYKVVSKPGAK